MVAKINKYIFIKIDAQNVKKIEMDENVKSFSEHPEIILLVPLHQHDKIFYFSLYGTVIKLVMLGFHCH